MSDYLYGINPVTEAINKIEKHMNQAAHSRG